MTHSQVNVDDLAPQNASVHTVMESGQELTQHRIHYTCETAFKLLTADYSA